jgi:hypothetical protein
VSSYSRREILTLFGIDDEFLITLEREEIVHADAATTGTFSEQMLERVRVAHNLVHELDVNLAGVAIILHMREQMSSLHSELEETATALRRHLGERKPR